jgi:hypothetical protein
VTQEGLEMRLFIGTYLPTIMFMPNLGNDRDRFNICPVEKPAA